MCMCMCMCVCLQYVYIAYERISVSVENVIDIGMEKERRACEIIAE